MDSQEDWELYKEAGDGIVNADGIRFLGRTYTLSWAVRRQWFTRAIEEGPWPIRMYVQRQSMQLFIKEQDEYYICMPTMETDEELEAIHNKRKRFAELKQLWFEARAGNKRNHHFPGKRTNR
ncbi:hypothetical protein [Paenibacillus sp. HJGM_3]|uniref:hypothetical protein n=1 Tax=Paenibacillus sp. HJGM_3 TaxID=3379816 RepID=UPI00385991C0